MQSILSQTGVIVAGVVGWLFFAGFWYVYIYFKYFGLPITQAEIPYHTFIMDGSFVVEHCYMYILLLCTSLIVQAYFIWRMNLSGLRALVIVTANIVVCFAAAYTFSHKTAKDAILALEKCQRQPSDRFTVDNHTCDAGPFIRVFLQGLDANDLFLHSVFPSEPLLCRLLHVVFLARQGKA